MHKCHYCDFNSHVRNSPPWHEYGQALIREIRARGLQPAYSGRPLATVFFGGGTPSLAPPSLIARVLEEAAKVWAFMEATEITLEANPGTVDRRRFQAFRAAGINRLSIGAQSLDDAQLRWLERIHDHRDIEQAADAARQAGFDNLNLDLIYGLPGQTTAQWIEILDRALAMGPEHLSCYQLTIEPHTRLAARHQRRPYAMPDDSLALQMLRETRARLAASGFAAYEVSNFARPGHMCRHNDAYWRYMDYVGIGAGAAGKFDLPDGGICRYANRRRPEGYIKAALAGAPEVGKETLPRDMAAAEAIWLGLRRADGIALPAFLQRFGINPLQRFDAALRAHLDEGMIELERQQLRATEKGLPMLDAIAADVIAAASS